MAVNTQSRGRQYTDRPLDVVLKDFAKRLSDEQVRELNYKLAQAVGHDRADCVGLFQASPDVDRWLRSAAGASDWFDRVDVIREYVSKEFDRRNLTDGRMNRYPR